MARARPKDNGRLEDAMATLLHNQTSLLQIQASFLTRVSETDRQLAETNRQMAETNRINAERFARIEALLIEHNRILEALPDAIREKMGFQASARPPSAE